MILAVLIIGAIVFVGGVLVARNNIPWINKLFSLFKRGD